MLLGCFQLFLWGDIAQLVVLVEGEQLELGVLEGGVDRVQGEALQDTQHHVEVFAAPEEGGIQYWLGPDSFVRDLGF